MSEKLIQMAVQQERNNTSATFTRASDHQPERLATGTILAIDLDGRIVVAWPGNDAEPFAARTLVDILSEDVGKTVLLAFPSGETNHPVILGMVKDRCRSAPGQQVDVDRSDVQNYAVDGETIHLTAQREILLECGQGSIRLRKDGKIIIKGVQVVSRAKGINKIKGAAVSIN